jgi:hypothetical protein
MPDSPKNPPKKRKGPKRIVIVDLGNRDEDGSKLDLFSYLVNELEAHKIKVRIFEEPLKPDDKP